MSAVPVFSAGAWPAEERISGHGVSAGAWNVPALHRGAHASSATTPIALSRERITDHQTHVMKSGFAAGDAPQVTAAQRLHSDPDRSRQPRRMEPESRTGLRKVCPVLTLCIERQILPSENLRVRPGQPEGVADAHLSVKYQVVGKMADIDRVSCHFEKPAGPLAVARGSIGARPGKATAVVPPVLARQITDRCAGFEPADCMMPGIGSHASRNDQRVFRKTLR